MYRNHIELEYSNISSTKDMGVDQTV